MDSINQVDFPIVEGSFLDLRESTRWSESHVKNLKFFLDKESPFGRKLFRQFNRNRTALEEYLNNFRNDVAEHIKNFRIIPSTTQTSTEISENSRPLIETDRFEYDVAISFAGENREIAEQISDALIEKGIRVFYDELEEEKVRLWGKNLRDEFIKIYGGQARYVVVLISQYYPIKDWTNFEFNIAKDEAKRRKSEYILPIRLDDTKMVGFKYEIKYIDLRKEGIDEVVDLIIKKLTL